MTVSPVVRWVARLTAKHRDVAPSPVMARVRKSLPAPLYVDYAFGAAVLDNLVAREVLR